MPAWLPRLCRHPRLPLLLGALAVLLAAPSLQAGLVADDWFHRGMQGDVGLFAGFDPIFDAFAFFAGSAEGNRYIFESGMVPWWASPTVLARFFRPLAALTQSLDHALWPDSLVVQHAHSLLWFGAGVGLVALVLRRLLPAPAAGLAALLFAVEDTHSMAASWLANRNASMTLVFGSLLILAHLRWRTRGDPRFGALALLALVLGLASGEAALGAVAYVVAWQLVLDGPGWRRRLAGLAPYVVVVGSWRVAYSALGYGASGSGLYLDPGRSPGGFLLGLVERWPLLFASQWTGAPVDAWLFLPRSWQLAIAALATLLALPFLALFLPLLRRSVNARFWALGLALALIPLCGAFPMDRLLLWTGVGAFALLATAADDLGWLGSPRSPNAVGLGRLGIGLAAALLVLHGPIAAMLLPARCLATPLLGGITESGARRAPRDAALSGQTLVFLNGSELPLASTLVERVVSGELPAPRRLAMLASLATEVVYERPDDRTLLVTPARGFLADPLDTLSRSTHLDPFAVGDVVERPDYRVEVLEVEDGRPLSVRVRFEEPLESPSYRWVQYRSDGLLHEVRPPSVGGSLTTPATRPMPVRPDGEPMF